MKIEFDPSKREMTLLHRDLDLARAGEIFDGSTITVTDDRKDYGETRYISIGVLDERMVAVVWTWRATARRIISLRKANDREQKIYGKRLGRP